jgi:hypothetical protein
MGVRNNAENHAKLNVHGYIGPLFRIQTWIKSENNLAD